MPKLTKLHDYLLDPGSRRFKKNFAGLIEKDPIQGVAADKQGNREAAVPTLFNHEE
jgi:hypothetical protein